MNNFANFGKRLNSLRKAQNITQEQLAHMVGVTGQAVSKWETDLSYPDITIIPTLANILDTTVSYLFGEEEKTAPKPTTEDIPPTYQGLDLVHRHDNIACYSNKNLQEKSGTSVVFADGSTAELSSKTVFNKGQGDILFLNLSEPVEEIDMTVTKKSFNFASCKNLTIRTLLASECDVILSNRSDIQVDASGTPIFIEYFRCELEGDTLAIGYKDMHGNHNNNQGSVSNTITIEMPANIALQHLDIGINGNGNINTSILDFATGTLKINGNGNIQSNNFTQGCETKINGNGVITIVDAANLVVKINGNGVVNTKATQETDIKINGNGAINLEEAKDLAVKITGHGNVNLANILGGNYTSAFTGAGHVAIKNGTCQHFKAKISGAGDVSAERVTAATADIVIEDIGTVTLGRVTDHSREQAKQQGKIVILARG